jgi:hypothetical protein
MRPGTYREALTNEKEPASHILCDCQALAESRFHHLGKHVMKPGDLYEILLRKIPYFMGGTGLLADRRIWGCTKDQEMVAVQGSVSHPLQSHSFIQLKNHEMWLVSAILRFLNFENNISLPGRWVQIMTDCGNSKEFSNTCTSIIFISRSVYFCKSSCSQL